MKKSVLLTIFFLTLISSETFAFYGKFKNVVGVVSIVRNYDQTQKIEFVSDDGIVFEGDTIATGSGASCDIYWTDKIFTRLGPNTEINIYMMSIGEKKIFKNQKINLNIKLISGQLRNKLRKIDIKSETFKVTSPVAVVAVRGTDFTTNHNNNQTSVSVALGSVNVFNIATGKIQSVSQGQSITVAASIEQIEQINKTGAVPTIEFDQRGLKTQPSSIPGAFDKTINSPNIQNIQNLENNIIPKETILNIQGNF